MNQLAIYERLPIFLQSAIVAHYGRKLHRMRFGGAHDEQRAQILACEKMDREAMRLYQVDRLRAMLLEAAASIPYYRAKAESLRELASTMQDPSDIARLPLLEKATINADPTAFHSTDPRGKPIVGSTSGTTGRPLRTMKVPASYQRNWAFYERSKEIHGVVLGMRRATFGTRMVVPNRQRKPPFWRREPSENNLYFSLFHLAEQFLPAYVEQLRAWDPEEIVCFPSGLCVLAEHMVRRGVTVAGAKAVFCMSETLFDWQRELFEKAFGARVVNLYGLAENVAWIYECPSGRMHVRPDYGYVEFLPVPGATWDEEPAGEVREIVATGFLNLAMPLLRYRTGDQAVVTPQDATPCACGSWFPTVTRVIGRLDDNLITPDGRVQTRLDGIFKMILGVRESQLEQVAPDRLIVRVVPLGAFGPEAEAEVRLRIARIFGAEMQVEIRIVDALPRTKGGKVRYQVNSIPRGESRTAPAESER
jgi:phenylacetate-CoA ligase